MKFKKHIMVMMVALIALSTFLACSDQGSQSELKETGAMDKKTQLNVAPEIMSETLDPAKGWDSWFVMRWGAGECLVKYADDYSFQPWLAESWSVADDQLTWVFKLRDGIKFSNGTAMTASKVVASLERLFEKEDPKNGGNGNPHGHFTYNSITANDEENTVTIVTTTPTPDLPGCLAYPWTLIMDVDNQKDVATQGPITTGPYAFKKVIHPSEEILMTKNKHYWAGEVPFETVSIIKIMEPSTRTMALQDGSADMAMSISASDRKVLKQEGGYDLNVVNGSRIGFSHINKIGVLANETIRQALLLATDGQTIADITTKGSFSYGYSPIPPNFDYGYDQLISRYEYNPKEAVRILDKAGIIDTDGDGIRELNGKNIVLKYITATSRQADILAQAQAALWSEVGIGTNIQITDNLHDYMLNKKFDLVSSNEITMPTGDPAKFMRHWYSTSDNNYEGYSNPEFDKAYEALIKEFDVAKRKKYLIQLQQILLDDTATIVSGYYNFNICATPRVVGVSCPVSDFYWITDQIKPASAPKK